MREGRRAQRWDSILPRALLISFKLSRPWRMLGPWARLHPSFSNKLFLSLSLTLSFLFFQGGGGPYFPIQPYFRFRVQINVNNVSCSPLSGYLPVCLLVLISFLSLCYSPPLLSSLLSFPVPTLLKVIWVFPQTSIRRLLHPPLGTKDLPGRSILPVSATDFSCCTAHVDDGSPSAAALQSSLSSFLNQANKTQSNASVSLRWGEGGRKRGSGIDFIRSSYVHDDCKVI